MVADRGRPQVKRQTVACSGCGSPVERRESDLARLKSGRVFCSKECRGRVGSKPRRGVNVACQRCGSDIYQRPGQERRFCSKECHDEGQRVSQVMTACVTCGTGFRHQRSVSRKYCSKPCEANGRMVRALSRSHNGRPARINAAGYVMVWEPDHPASYSGWLLEHRLVAEQTLGRRLGRADEVHHINRNKADNRAENLVVLSGPDHSYITALDNWRDLKELKGQLARYRELYGELPEE